MTFGQPAVSILHMIIFRCSTGINLTFIEATVVKVLAASDASALLEGFNKLNIVIVSIDLKSAKIRMNEKDTSTQNRHYLLDYPCYPHHR